MFNKSQLTSKKFSKKRRNFFFIKIFFLSSLLVAFFFSASYLLENAKINIEKIEIKGNLIVEQETIRKVAAGELSGKYFSLVPKKNTFLYPKKNIEQKIKDQEKRIQSIIFERIGMTAVLLTVIERQPKFLWCDDFTAISEECYFIDETGFIFSKAPKFSDDVYFRFYGGGARQDAIGKQYLPPHDFVRISRFVEMTKESNIEASKLYLKEMGEYELHLQDGTRVLFMRSDDELAIFDNLKTVLQSEVFGKEVRNNPSPVDYIDLRYGNKVFYKFK